MFSSVRPKCVCGLTLSILEALGFRRRRRCRLIRREELCSVELLNLNTKIEENHILLETIHTYGKTVIYELITKYVLLQDN